MMESKEKKNQNKEKKRVKIIKELGNKI